MNPSKIVNEGVRWVVKENIALSTLTVGTGASVAAPEGYNVTMTVDGVGMPIKPGTYRGDITLSVTKSLFIQPGGLFAKGKPMEYRTAILIEDGKFVSENSVPAIVQGGKVTGKAAKGISISSCEENYNGIIVNGDSEYTIDDIKIDFEGDGVNDNIGYGAGITCIGKSKVTVNNSDIHLKGVTRCALHAGGNSVITLNNCTLSNESPATTRMSPLWALGLSGTNRTTQLCDNATVYYNKCRVISNGWGCLSIDGGVIVRMYLKDSTVDLKGLRSRGYGAFSIGNAFISYDNCVINVQGYPLLIGGGAGRPDQKSDGEFTNGCTVNSTLYGAMIFRSQNTELTVNKGTTFNTASSVFVVKGSNAYINVDNAKLNPANGVILQLQDNDEPGMGPPRFIVPLGADTPVPGRDLTKANANEDVFMTVSNMEVSGDFYNSTTNLKPNCVEKVEMIRDIGIPGGGGKMDTEAQQGVKNLDLKFANAKVTGIISAAAAAYKEGVRIIDAGNCKELSAVTQTAKEPINNGVIVLLDKDSVWTVTGTSYLSSLSLAKGAAVKAPKGKKVTMTVDGVKKEIAAGKYKGNIVIKVA